MKQQTMSTKTIRQRNLLLALPLLSLPFITMLFWALGGGKDANAQQIADDKKGVNLSLPDAQTKDREMDKMSYYDQAQSDSLKFLELLKNDPNYQGMHSNDSEGYAAFEEDSLPGRFDSRGLNPSLYNNYRSDPKTDAIYDRLAALDREMRRPPEPAFNNGNYNQYDQGGYSNTNRQASSGDIDRLEQMMQTMNQPSGNDREMNQINGMLEKILDVQHPERVQERLKQSSEEQRGKVFAVAKKTARDPVSVLDGDATLEEGGNGFYSINETAATESIQNAIQAVVHESQTLVNGSTVKLRLVNDIIINGVSIPKDHFVFGKASLDGERLKVEVKSIRYRNALFPVELSVCDMDGMAGIHIPGAVTRDVAKQSADRSLQTIGLNGLDPSWQAQAASVGIETVKTLFSKKVKLVKVQVKAGYQVLLKNEKED